MTHDERLQALKDWVQQQLQTTVTLKQLQGDASFRRYFVINGGDDYLAVDAPPKTENNQGFVAMSQHLANLGLYVPHITHQDLYNGFFIISYLKGELYYSALIHTSSTTLYTQAIDQLVHIQQAPLPTFYDPPEFNAIKLTNELEGFQNWFVNELLQYECSGEEYYRTIKCYEKLIQNAINQPYVLIHRDFHSRNLLFNPHHNPSVGILDFQDALIGPITYDLVSLLRDCYITWPNQSVEEWLEYYHLQAKAHGLLKGVTHDQLQQWFDWMGVQRHLKAIYIFTRKYLRDHNDFYLQFIEPTLQYVTQVTQHYETLAPLYELISMNLEPLWTELQHQ